MNNNHLREVLRAIIRRHIGRDRAITSSELCEMVRVPDRAVRLAIEELIDDGFPVCSTTKPPAGYFFPSSVEEARVYSKPLQKRAVMIFLRKRKIVKNAALFYEPASQGRLI